MNRIATNRKAAVALLALAAATALNTLALTGLVKTPLTEGSVGDWVYNLMLAAAAAVSLTRTLDKGSNRGVWLLIGLAVASWAAGNIYYTAVLVELDPMPFPSPADAAWLAFYPLAYVGLVLLVRGSSIEFQKSMWLDGLIGALAVAALGTALVFGAVRDVTEGETLVVATNLAYPLGDLLLLALVVGVLSLTGWRPGRTWGYLATGFAVFALTDSVYLFQISAGTYEAGTILDAGWIVGLTLIACASWQPRPRSGVRVEGKALLVTPTAFGLLALTLLVYDHFRPVDLLALVLSAACILAVIVRMGFTVGENIRMLTSSRVEATTDALTGLGNRRKLLADLQRGEGEPSTLLLFDLDGFKSYNDTYGHPAGDDLLVRLGRALAAAVEPYGTAYRMGGDEFCVLANRSIEAERLGAEASSALSERGEGFTIESSYGFVVIPEEASNGAVALKLADQRMYAHKQSRRGISANETRDVLLRALGERDPELKGHAEKTARLAAAVARRLELTEAEVDRVVRAAELHDVGKVAIPDAILQRTSPLGEDEWSFIRRHTTIGERIVATAPALAEVALIIRSHHERWDGAGYPDRLAKEQIPLEARIVAVCDAFTAMTSERPYRQAASRAAALAELERCGGTQFDPTVVTAFLSVLAQRSDGNERAALRHPGSAAPPLQASSGFGLGLES